MIVTTTPKATAAATPPAQPFTPVRMSIDTVTAGKDGVSGEWMRGTVGFTIDLRPAGTPDIEPTTMRAVSELQDGTKVIDMEIPFEVSPTERAAATALAQAFEGSEILKQAVPYAPGDVADNTARMVLEDAAGTKLMYTEPAGAPDNPGDASLKAALNGYLTAIGAN